MKKKKIFIISLIIIMILLFTNNVFAFDQNFYNNKINGEDTTSIFTAGGFIINFVQLVGVGMAVISSLILGIRYMTSSPNERADIKSRLIPWITGGVLIFGAVQIVKFIEQVASM